jgi:hypothetical protein
METTLYDNVLHTVTQYNAAVISATSGPGMYWYCLFLGLFGGAIAVLVSGRNSRLSEIVAVCILVAGASALVLSTPSTVDRCNNPRLIIDSPYAIGWRCGQLGLGTISLQPLFDERVQINCTANSYRREYERVLWELMTLTIEDRVAQSAGKRVTETCVS